MFITPNLPSTLVVTVKNDTGVTDIEITATLVYRVDDMVRTVTRVQVVATSAINSAITFPLQAYSELLSLYISEKANAPVYISTYLRYPGPDASSPIFQGMKSGWLMNGAASTYYGIDFLNEKPSEWAMWAYRAVITQEHTTSYAVVIKISPVTGNSMKVIHTQIGPDDNGGDRQVTATINDGTYDVSRIFSLTTLDNETGNVLPNLGAAAGDNALPAFRQELPIEGPDELRITAVSLAESETLTVAVRALIKNAAPTVTISTTTYSSSVTYNKVI